MSSTCSRNNSLIHQNEKNSASQLLYDTDGICHLNNLLFNLSSENIWQIFFRKIQQKISEIISKTSDVVFRPSRFFFYWGVHYCVSPSPFSLLNSICLQVSLQELARKYFWLALKRSNVWDLECKMPDKNKLQGLGILLSDQWYGPRVGCLNVPG